MTTEVLREYWKQKQREHRAKKKVEKEKAEKT